MKKVIFVLGAIVVLVLLAGTCSQQIKETYRNINEMNNEKQNCMGGCREPTQLYGNCSSKVEKDKNGIVIKVVLMSVVILHLMLTVGMIHNVWVVVLRNLESIVMVL